MLKYKDTMITFEEVPSEVSLCINISGCMVQCPECHSKHLWENTGTDLTTEELNRLIQSNKGITCVAFMGGDHSEEDIYKLADWIRENTNLKICWYSGKELRNPINLALFDFIKTGPYKAELGGLDSITTNQKFFEVHPKYDIAGNLIYHYLTNVTYKFQKSNEGNNTDDLG